MHASGRDPLIDPDDLAVLVASGGCTVLDVRYRMGGPPGAAEYARGHVPGAAYVDLDTALASAPGPGGRHPLPDPAVFEDAMRAGGVRNDLPVVVYDDWAGRAAARCWWLLRWAGHEDVRVLDGGWSAWVEAGHEQSDVQKSPQVGDFAARPGLLHVLAVDDVLGVVERGVLIDARDAERFRGEVEPVDPVAGHVPGAVNVPTGANLTGDGRFRSAGDLRRVYAAAEGREAAVYCGSGVTAAHDILAMAVAGIDATLYPGSWSEWVTDPTRPVATGD
ncbi:MAG: rhodanese-like protein [Marmoricola sp.]|jgi:thiosulfate/3-mercaptopyruvate sulfurtransferase|nr:rhodanese-like protein [Marmoricola sp.]MCW2838050.1 rhodanese-like protein [Marmoricola sp.]